MTSETNTLTVITGQQVTDILAHREYEVLNVIRDAYTDHEEGQSSLPHSVFLRFPDRPATRIIGLPAYVGGESPVAGMKWVASFPDNIHSGMDRASAVIILNSPETGQPYGILEGSVISAQRTAASAALAATVLHGAERPDSLSLIGCGLINSEILRFSRFALRSIDTVHVYDREPDRAEQFAQKMTQGGEYDIRVHRSLATALRASRLVSFATTAPAPHLDDPNLLQDGAVALHVSLRDLSPRVISQSTNVVDDLDHVNREGTSIYLTAQELGHTNFVTATLGELLLGTKTLSNDGRGVIFSPFGLGVLDMRLAAYVHARAATNNGHEINHFLPPPWVDRI